MSKSREYEFPLKRASHLRVPNMMNRNSQSKYIPGKWEEHWQGEARFQRQDQEFEWF